MGSETSAALYQPGNWAGLRGVSTAHQGQLWVGGAHISGNSALIPRSHVLPLAARRLIGYDHDQGLDLPDFTFLLYGLEQLVLAKV